MTNIKLSQDGNKLTLEIDLSEDHGPSASGKTASSLQLTAPTNWTPRMAKSA